MTTSPKTIAHDVVIDYRDESISINGVRFPYYVMPDPEVEVVQDGSMGILHVGILANNLSVIGSQGTVKTVAKAPMAVELDWAVARAKELVHEGLAPVLAWIEKGMPK
jgi:hypothetical protein